MLRPDDLFASEKLLADAVAGSFTRADSLLADELTELLEARGGSDARQRMRRWEQEIEQCQAAAKARDWWRHEQPAARHPYLADKGIRSHGCRQAGPVLLVPMRDAAGRLWNLQRIYPDRAKRFLKNGRTAGLFCKIPGGPRILLCEGFATGASLHEHTGDTVICVMSAQNLPAVAAVLPPEAEIIICADNDPTGLEYGRLAAEALGGAEMRIPREAGTDWNDELSAAKEK